MTILINFILIKMINHLIKNIIQYYTKLIRMIINKLVIINKIVIINKLVIINKIVIYKIILMTNNYLDQVHHLMNLNQN